MLATFVAVLLGVPAAASAQSVSHACDTATTHDGCERWYTASAVSLRWEWSPTGVPTSGCDNETFFSEGRYSRSCTVEWADGSSVFNPVWIGIDRSAPVLVGITPSRPPDYNGWFNHPVGVVFQGRDSVSGVASCTSTTFGGPAGQGVPISGSCTDVAGHTGSGVFRINYDATAPAPPALNALPGYRTVRLNWTSTPDTHAVVVRLAEGDPPVLVYRGSGGSFVDRALRNERRYRYVVTLIDQAGNRADAETSTVPTASKLLLPSKGTRFRRRSAILPLLVWKRVRRARYYNVQIFRKRKVLSAWPKKPQLQMKSRWRYRGKRYRLRPGRYCWHVWPGYGRRSEHRYGKRLGRSCFRVTR